MNDSPTSSEKATTPILDGRAFAIAAARIAADNRTEDVVVLDVRELCTFTDFFVLGTGTSDRQMSAVMDQIREFGRDRDWTPMRKSNLGDGKWILADYVDVVIHLFDEEHRDYYDLESLWGDAARIAWRPDDTGQQTIAEDPSSPKTYD
jgi:ribosome-associated protein